jgi:AI-2E family transporter
MRAPINTLQLFLQQVEDIGGTAPSPNGAISERGTTLLMTLFTGTRNFASGLFMTVLFLFFLLVSGDIFLHRLVEILPRFRSKRQVVEISQQIESDVSAYVVTITIMNAAVGIATALAMWLTGVGDPILWGTVAFLLNYVPILGTALGVLIFLLAGLLTHDTLWQAMLPAGLYFGFHLIEGETVTPMLLARRFTLNPVLVIISLVFWFWMWGIPGAILYAIVFSRWLHSVIFLRGEPSRFLTLRFTTDRGRAISRACPGKHACPVTRERALLLTYFCAVVSLVDCSAGSFVDCPRGPSKWQYQGGLVEKDAGSSKSVMPGRRPIPQSVRRLGGSQAAQG